MLSKRKPVSVGATVEQYPVNAWSRLPKGVSVEDLWQLCGPQVEQHMQRLPLWKVFALVYFEGVAHGSAAERNKVGDARGALQNLLDVFHQGQVTVRPEAEGYVASVIEAGELLLKGD